MQTTIIFLMYKTFYFKFIFIHMNRICDLQITQISYFVLCIASLRIFYNGVSWNSRFTNADHAYLCRNWSYIDIIYHWFRLRPLQGRHIIIICCFLSIVLFISGLIKQSYSYIYRWMDGRTDGRTDRPMNRSREREREMHRQIFYKSLSSLCVLTCFIQLYMFPVLLNYHTNIIIM